MTTRSNPGVNLQPLLFLPVLWIAWGGSVAAQTGSLSVNTASREEVRSFYNAVYTASDGVPIGTTAEVANCIPGTNSLAFREAVRRRVNWYRAMAGMPGNVIFDETQNNKNQQAALMMSANNALDHFPPANWLCYTQEGADAAPSNLAIYNYGADAITSYIDELLPSAGHRRQVLYPPTQVMATGDVPPQGTKLGANALWVFDIARPRPATRDPFVSWPPPGFVPYQAAYRSWSFGYAGADFSGARVSMRSNNVAMTVTLQPVETNYADNTLVWRPTNFSTNRPAADIIYSVTVSNVVINGSSSNFSYSVTVFDPAVAGSDFHPPTITGPDQPLVGQNNRYTFNAITNATYQWRQTQRASVSVSDGAENGLGGFGVGASSNLYAVIVSDVFASGAHSFHLCHSNITDQTLVFTNQFYGGPNSVLTFKSRLAAATTNQFARIQASTDAGATWTDLYSQGGNGFPGESVFTSRSVSLSSLAAKSVRLRINYKYSSTNFGAYYNQTTSSFGWYLDDLVVTNIEQLLTPLIIAASVTNFDFNPPQAGAYNLDVRAMLFGEFPLDWGPAKPVTASNGPIVRIARPLVSGNQVRLDFNLLSGSPGVFTLERVSSFPSTWNNDTAAVLTTNVPGSSYRFTTTTNGAAARRFYRVRLQ